jgi:adenylate kinase family enzyme
MIRLIFVMGPTNVGKGTLLAAASKIPHVGLVEVGKMMRAKYLDPKSPFYDPDHFKGQAAPKHTQAEAWQMMLDGIEAAKAAKKLVIFIDGQPRDVEQAQKCAFELEGYDKRFISLHADHDIRLRRAILRDGGDDANKLLAKLELGKAPDPDLDHLPPALRLSIQRMTTDYRGQYEVQAKLALCGRVTFFHDTSYDGYSYDALAAELSKTTAIPGQQTLFDE